MLTAKRATTRIELSPKAAGILENQSVLLPIEAACEVVYVLQKVYRVARQQIQERLSELVDESLITLEKPAVDFVEKEDDWFVRFFAQGG